MKGVDVITAFLNTLPPRPGVYRMLDERGEALYVGKALSLKNRVAAYTKPERCSVRIQRMIAQTVSMDCTVTPNEAKALLLEADLIKSLKPRYNILLRDDKSFPSLLLTGGDYPRLVKHRGARDEKGDYFGPFASGTAVNETLAVLQKAFRLRDCSDPDFATRCRPCLQHQIGRCTAPCVGKVSQQEYAAQVDGVRNFLAGKSEHVRAEAQRQMEDASTRRDYEAAAILRDRLRALNTVRAAPSPDLADVDVFGLAEDGGETCVQAFFYRGGASYGHRAFFPQGGGDDPAETLSSFIMQFYQRRTPPPQVLLSHGDQALEPALSEKAGRRVRVRVPRHLGAALDAVALAADNAQEALGRRRAEGARQAELLALLATAFDLAAPPERIEIYDNSHIQGAHAVGAMVAAGPEGFITSAYRIYNIDTKEAGDDFAMMRLVFARRFKGESPRPDFILIDGGAGQLSAAQAALESAGVRGIALAAMAKGEDRNAGRERFFIPGRDEPLTLPHNDPLLHYLQRLRDEAHRFAITSHRKRRSRSARQNPLDTVPGIGGKRKKALLLHFGSAKAVAEASVDDLQKADGISAALAKSIHGFFHGGG
jgi:excinuclease ABC subunit C